MGKRARGVGRTLSKAELGTSLKIWLWSPGWWGSFEAWPVPETVHSRQAKAGVVAKKREDWQAGSLPLMARSLRLMNRGLQRGTDKLAACHRNAKKPRLAGMEPQSRTGKREKLHHVSRQKPAGRAWQARTGITRLLKSEGHLVPQLHARGSRGSRNKTRRKAPSAGSVPGASSTDEA